MQRRYFLTSPSGDKINTQWKNPRLDRCGSVAIVDLSVKITFVGCRRARGEVHGGGVSASFLFSLFKMFNYNLFRYFQNNDHIPARNFLEMSALKRTDNGLKGTSTRKTNTSL